MIEILRLPALRPVEIVGDVALLDETSLYLARVRGGSTRDRLALGERELRWSEQHRGWTFETGFEAGEGTLRATTDGGRVLRFRVRPAAEKLGEERWLRIVTDVEGWLPAATVGFEGAGHGAVGIRGTEAPLAASALGPLVEPLRRALAVVTSAPREEVVATRREVPAHAVRRADRAVLRWLLRHPSAWGAIGHRVSATEEGHAHEPHVPVRWTENTLDHPAHRYLAWLLERAERALAALVERLEAAARGNDDTRTAAWCTARAARMDSAQQLVGDTRRRTWLRGVRAAPISEAALLAVLDDPAFARAHALLRRFVRPLFSTQSGEDEVRAPVRATYDVYEIWCFLALHAWLRENLAGGRWWRRGVSAERFGAGRGHGARFAAELPQGRLELHFNMTFPGFLSRGTSPRFSLSGERRPDLVMSWQPIAGGGARWLALDAKYRVRPKHLADAFASAHLYRDALRWRDRGGQCEAALLLVPSMQPRCEPWFEDSFTEEHAVGAMVMAPGESVQRCGERALRLLGVSECGGGKT